jgi:hypothetical protein
LWSRWPIVTDGGGGEWWTWWTASSLAATWPGVSSGGMAIDWSPIGCVHPAAFFFVFIYESKT